MNKKELTSLAAKEAGVSQKDAGKVLTAILENISKSIVRNESVTLLGFGTFSTKERPARNGYNPLTMKPIKIEARKVVKFNPSKAIKDKY